jgi:hypothetical protein
VATSTHQSWTIPFANGPAWLEVRLRRSYDRTTVAWAGGALCVRQEPASRTPRRLVESLQRRPAIGGFST